MKKYLKKTVTYQKLEKDYNDFKLQYNKQSVAEILIQLGVKTTIQISYYLIIF